MRQQLLLFVGMVFAAAPLGLSLAVAQQSLAVKAKSSSASNVLGYERSADENSAQATSDRSEMAASRNFWESLQFSTGEINLPGGFAKLKLSPRYYYLAPHDAQRVLEEAWGNPPGAGANTLGMVFPAGENHPSHKEWGIIISFDPTGYVADKGATAIDFDKQLVSMQQRAEEANTQRQQLGYETVNLLGWAVQPQYDSDAKQLIWAKELQFGEAETHTLNYNTRLLGRSGVLSLSAIAEMERLKEIEPSIREVLASTRFTAGHRYADYDPATDAKSEFGLAELVAGEAAAPAARLSFFAKYGKLLIVGVLALVGLLLFALSKK